jgi:3-oxoacyl-[acyl-carrier protein] reductase
VAIVTGAARGLGRGYATRLAGLGTKVAVADLSLRSYVEFEAEPKPKEMTADSTVAEIEASGGTEVDVRDHESVEGMVARVVQEWGRIDILLANAGGGSLPSLKQQRSRKIITVSSVAGTAPFAYHGYAHYGAAKAAIAHYRAVCAGSRDIRNHRQLHSDRRDRDRADHANR